MQSKVQLAQIITAAKRRFMFKPKYYKPRHVSHILREAFNNQWHYVYTQRNAL